MFGKLYRTAQYLSLDIVLGAVILLRFFSSILSVSPGIPIYFLLGSSVWMIYTVDHLRDAEKAAFSKRGRYQFHKKYKKLLKLFIGTVLSISLVLIFYVDRMIIEWGMVLSTLSFVYLFVQQFLARWGLKELYVSIIYSSGILLAPFALASSIVMEIYLPLVLLTFLNLIIFSWFEREADQQDGFSSIAIILPSKWLEMLILILVSLGLAFIILVDFSRLNLYYFIAFSIYGGMLIKYQWVSKDERYRLLGDGVFLLPIFFEWL